MAVDENSERIAKKFGIITPPNISTPDERPSQINQIFTGWANYVKNKFDILSPEIKVLSESRLLECDACHMRSGHQCDPRKKGKHVKSGNTVNGCGCNIAAKTMSPGSICPLGKW
jgi:hypothetical protein|tara:strand:+ start:443 stop:787 length:345 start_codon:yes stop_codon:yes gene_type:complete